MRKRRVSRKRANGKKCLYLRKEIADIDYRNSKDTWKQIGTIFNLRRGKTERVKTAKAEAGVLEIF